MIPKTNIKMLINNTKRFLKMKIIIKFKKNSNKIQKISELKFFKKNKKIRIYFNNHKSKSYKIIIRILIKILIQINFLKMKRMILPMTFIKNQILKKENTIIIKMKNKCKNK